jgi:hypothetical protein
MYMEKGSKHTKARSVKQCSNEPFRLTRQHKIPATGQLSTLMTGTGPCCGQGPRTHFGSEMGGWMFEYHARGINRWKKIKATPPGFRDRMYEYLMATYPTHINGVTSERSKSPKA